MIVPMTKYSLLIYHRSYNSFLDDLRNLGIAHIIENNQNVSDEIMEQYQHITQLNRVIRFLEAREVSQGEKQTQVHDGDGEIVFEKVGELRHNLEVLKQKQNSTEKQLAELEPWGDFSPARIKELREEGLNIRLFVTQNRRFEESWLDEYEAFILNTTSGYTYFAILERGEEIAEINAEEFPLPQQSLTELRNLFSDLREEEKQTEKHLDEIALNGTPTLLQYRKQLVEKIEYDKAVHHTLNEAENNIKVAEIWCPDEKVEVLESYLNSSDAYYIKSSPTSGEKVPVLLKNKKFNKDFEVIGEMYSLPKYGEMDLTPFFAPFYALFFGFCLGDLGYGILMTVMAFVMKPRVGKELKPVMNLVAYLGAATMLFGLIGGTFFGINLYMTNLPFYSSMQSYFSTQNTDINTILFYLSLLIGGVQILFGLILKAINEIIQYGWKLAVGTIGWIVLLTGGVSLYLISTYTAISVEAIALAKNTLLIVSGMMILLFNNLKRKIYLNLGIGLWNSYNMITGILGDLLSYIRLFALGISSAILGFVFNSLAISMSGDIPVVSAIIMVIILVFGHAINIFMSGLGAFVHPMRLTFVEFYKNAGFIGGGKKYNPFRKYTDK